MRVRRADGLVWRRAGSRVVAMRPGERDPVILQGSALVLWEVLSTELSVDEAVRLLAEIYGAEPDRVGTDVQRALEELTDHRLVDVVEGEG